MALRLAAVIVTFGQGAGRVAGLIDQLSAVADAVIVVENTPDAEPPDIPGTIGIVNGNSGGLAGAYNRALAELDRDIDLIVFVDQDSDASVLAEMLADPEIAALLLRDDVAAVAPIYRERATGLRGRPAVLQGRWRVSHLPRAFDDLRRTTMTINSMTVWRRPALTALGRFDEGLGVDHVDTDMALRAADAGLAIWVSGAHVFDHEIGARKAWRAFGRTFQTGGHSPARRRQFARNLTILSRRWLFRYPGFALMSLAMLLYQGAGILVAEDRKLAKLGAMARGTAEGLFRGR